MLDSNLSLFKKPFHLLSLQPLHTKCTLLDVDQKVILNVPDVVFATIPLVNANVSKDTHKLHVKNKVHLPPKCLYNIHKGTSTKKNIHKRNTNELLVIDHLSPILNIIKKVFLEKKKKKKKKK